MGLTDTLYTLAIWPVKAIIEFLFIFFNRTFYSAALGIIFLSAAVNTLLLPIYAVADRWQREERFLQARMAKKLADIRAVFKGDERQMILNTYYRQMGYSPLSGLKSSVGLLLQIPFFIAAYQLLSHTPALLGESFWALKNLGEGDGLLRIGNAGFNVMPFLMTGINILSALVYARELGKREKAQLFGMALIFLVLLYDSPSGLVLYWTCNNLFSLGKNIAVSRLKRPARALQIAVSLLALALIGGALFGVFDVDRYVFLFVALGLCLLLAPFLWKALEHAMDRLSLSVRDCRLLYFSAAALLCLLLGLLIPAQVVGGSVAEFDPPWSFVFRSLVQGISFCVFLPLLIWSFAGKQVRKVLSLLLSVLALLSLICLFALSASYGLISRSFKIEDPQLIVNAFPLWVNPAALAAAVAAPALFFLAGKQRILAGLFNATALAIIVMAAITMRSIVVENRELAKLGGPPAETADNDVFQFTETGNNTFIMFLDRAVGMCMYPALAALPELSEQFDGFTWHPNSLSFGHTTVTGLPAMLGGYDYTPLRIDERSDVLLKDKINESLTMLPKIFGEAGFRVTVTDPTMTNMQLVPDVSVFDHMENVRAMNLDGKMERRFTEAYPVKDERFIDSFDFDILFRYGLFRIALPVLRYGLHYKGTWWRDGASNVYGRALTEFSTLYYLSEFCSVDSGADTLNIFMNETTHEPGAYTAALRPEPGLIRYSREEIDAFGSEDNASYMYTFLSAMKAINRWIVFLKEAGVYDNTKIIIVSDHGNGFDTELFEETGMESYNPLLMVKPFNARGPLAVSQEFMTNADVPAIAAAGAIDHPVNPYLGTPVVLKNDKIPQTVARGVSFQPRRHGPYVYNLSGIREFTGPDIFRASSWGPWREIKRR
ncbi:MAG: YidC/Oxa1 family membrane protein insertase [Treponema sp.]|jgi:YidC/Oxa1 family membrane protein insertase|nr:YidC/Oxa1 family membrane protein insertase [Treponema sp.]